MAALEARHKRWSLAKVAAEAYDAYDIWMRFMYFFQFCESVIGTTVVYKDDFVALSKGIELGR